MCLVIHIDALVLGALLAGSQQASADDPLTEALKRKQELERAVQVARANTERYQAAANQFQAVIDACATPAPAVIACGGGAVVDADNRRRLHRAGFVMWLQAAPATLMARVKTGSGRPLLEGRGTATLERLAVVRAAAYEATADALVDTDGRTVHEVVDAVLEVYGQ